MDTTVQLIEVNGDLCIPNVQETADEWGRTDEILVCVYDSGDCDTIPWPMNRKGSYGMPSTWTKEQWDKALTSALYDAREIGHIAATVRAAILPDGTTLDF